MAATLLHGIATMHTFFDGNKRMAFMAVNMPLKLQVMRMITSKTAAASFTLLVARGKKTEDQVPTWISYNSPDRVGDSAA